MNPGTLDPPALRRGVRLVRDPVRDRAALLYPEGVLLLNETAAEVVSRCDGRSVEQIAADLAAEFDGVTIEDVVELVADLARRRLLSTVDGTGGAPRVATAAGRGTARHPAPLGLLAELTYRCPLHCTYCANPVELTRYRDELGTGEWLRVFDEARELGVLQVHLSGGEPLLRKDLTTLIGHASDLGMYTNLVTSGIPLDADRLAELADAGLDHFQLSIQDSDRAGADAIAGLRGHDRKLLVAEQVRALGLPLTVNVVLHRANVARLLPLAALAVELGADRVELAHTQFYGWALRNRAALMPTPEQVAAAQRDAAVARQRYGDAIELVHVVADYHTGTPKPCMYGWGSRQLVVAPNGDVLPCLAAAQLPGLDVVNVADQSLSGIWYDSAAFNRFRGTEWLPEPCHSCALREVDLGGCRCQAYQLTGDATVTDPVCELSPHHDLVTALVAGVAGVTGDAGDVAPAVPRRMR
jgi:pyrroloquinoline quinone biosynthesis protein E